MDGYEVKKVMDQVHISSEMQEEVIMNIQKRMAQESRNTGTRNFRKMVTAAAALAVAAGVISFPVRAVVSSVVQERMESVPKEEMTGINDMVQSQHEVLADGFSREYSASEKERKAMSGVAKLAREKAKKVSLHNPKLRDCRIHYNDPLKANAKEDRRDESAIFITEGDSASGTITKVRNAETQAVFSLRGKPLNSYGMTQEVVYKNDEFNLLQAALNIEDGIDGLRYNKVIIATDADVDGMHIRLLVITFFLMFFPDLVKKGHVYILQTPLFRVRNKNTAKRSKKKRGKAGESGEKDTFYCYTDEERESAIARLGSNAEITRFKGLGEINDVEFAEFIGPGMRLDPVKLKKEDTVEKLLEFYMGKNTMERQNFIIENLVVEDDSEI